MISRIENYLKPLKETPWYSARTRKGASAQSNPEARPLIGPVGACVDIGDGCTRPVQRPFGPMGPGRVGQEALTLLQCQPKENRSIKGRRQIVNLHIHTAGL